MATHLKCPACGRDNFTTQKGLKQHLQKNEVCKMKLEHAFKKQSTKARIAHDYVQMTTITGPKATKQPASFTEMLSKAPDTRLFDKPSSSATSPKKRTFTEFTAESEDFVDVMYDDEASDEDFFVQGGAAAAANLNQEESSESDEATQCDTSMRNSFQEYAEKQQKKLYLFEKERCAINLLLRLRKTKAPLNTYESVMHWHFVSNGDIRERQSVSDATDYISKEKVFQKLRERYKYDKGYHQTTSITLPHSKAKTQIVWNDAKEVLISLLTDPRITDDDYSFFENNPLASPPAHLNYVQDLNTGRAYTKTYERLINVPGKQVLLPVVFYIDAAVTGQFADLPVTAVKLSLGIFSRKAREKDYCWRTLGYIPETSKFKSKGRRILIESLHHDGIMGVPDALDDEESEDDEPVSKAQDFHAMIAVVLRSYVKLQNSGFIWDLPYNGTVYKDIEFVLFTPFVKCDGEEGDKLCGKYTTRTGNVAQLCRYCECPTDKTDDIRADFKLKTKKKINAYIRQNNANALQNMSQHAINNAFYPIRFGLHNKQSIHGACPWEILHAFLLGWDRYTRDCFFTQMGEKSQVADDINAICKLIGELISRQSDRDLPRTKFANGIKRGKLMASEYAGILLCIAAVLISTKSRALLKKRKAHFGTDDALRDWSTLVETLLQWERWLKSTEMEKKHVKKARNAHRYIMYLMKKVAKRTQGMQLKIIKFHGVVHLAEDILNFGVPMEVDTGANESGHKPTKVAALLTQKNEETFDQQTAIRLEEIHLLDMAKAEFEGKPVFNYGRHKPEPVVETEVSNDKMTIGGAKLTVFKDEESGYIVTTDKKSDEEKELKLETTLLEYVSELQDVVIQYIPTLHLRTTHKRKGQIFRGQGTFRNKVWRDWAMIDWDEEGKLPCKIYGFVDLRDLPQKNHGLKMQGTPLGNNIYAIVEAAVFDEDVVRKQMSEIFVPITKEVGQITNNAVSRMKFYLADVEAIVSPIAVIPDIGGNPNDYFMIKDRETWRTDFIDFLENFGNLEDYVSSDEDESADDSNDEE